MMATALALPEPTERQPLERVLGELESADRILVEQVIKPIANEYRLSIPAQDTTEEGTPLLHVKQKKLAIREEIRFRLSPDDESHAFMIKARSALELNGRYDVLDAGGAFLGTLEKDFVRSLTRSHWRIRDAAGAELFEAHEARWTIALTRRANTFLPDWLQVLDWLPFNFVFRRDGDEVGRHRRVLGKLGDRYVLDIGEGLGDVDRRLLVAFAVALDALQDR
jgi:uncharacterized protein YxjI